MFVTHWCSTITNCLIPRCSSENVRFWCAVNDYRAKFLDEEKSSTPTPPSEADDDESKAPEDAIGQSIVVDTREINDVARELYASFIAANSDTPVNLSSAQRSEIKVAVESGKTTKCTFDRAQREIFSVMSRDSYPRYLASKLNRKPIWVNGKSIVIPRVDVIRLSRRLRYHCVSQCYDWLNSKATSSKAFVSLLK
jgi:hypothetical protein